MWFTYLNRQWFIYYYAQVKIEKKKILLSEEAIVLDLAEAVEYDMRGYDEGKIKIHSNCRKVWDC